MRPALAAAALMAALIIGLPAAAQVDTEGKVVDLKFETPDLVFTVEDLGGGLRPGSDEAEVARDDLQAHAARGQGAQRVFLEVRPSNGAARALYGRAGFSEQEVRTFRGVITALSRGATEGRLLVHSAASSEQDRLDERPPPGYGFFKTAEMSPPARLGSRA